MEENKKDEMYLNIEYLDAEEKKIYESLIGRNYKQAANALDYLNEFLKSTIYENQGTDIKKTNQMNQKYEHMLQVVEEALDYAEGDGNYPSQKSKHSEKEKEMHIIIGILHDVGRIFEIKALGTSGYNMKFNHAQMGEKFLKEQNRLATFLKNDESFSQEEKETILYCVSHHGDKDIPADCPEQSKPFLESIRKLDKIANLIQGDTVPVDLITGSFKPEEIASISDPNHDGVIDEITYAELTNGALSSDQKTVYKGVDRQRKDVEYTPMRMYLSRVGWLYSEENDIDFYKFCKDKSIITRYCGRIRDFLPEREKQKLDNIVTFSEKYIDSRIQALSENKIETVPKNDGAVEK